eukprot:gene4324-5050_t
MATEKKILNIKHDACCSVVSPLVTGQQVNEKPKVVKPLQTTLTSPAPLNLVPQQTAASLIGGTPSKPSFYQRPLPSHLIAFSSDEGKRIFRESLTDGNMEGYFSLAEQFVSQSDPAYPKRLWKGPWRWFAEDMLDCCTPIESVKKRGITFTEFACLSRCNGANIRSFRGDESSLEHFRESIVDACSKQGLHLVISYSRKVLGQTGSGHYSPIGGYHKERDLALVLDVARFKYSPHWVPVQVLWDSMRVVDAETKKPRGYYMMSSDPSYQPSFCRVKNTLSWAGIADKFMKSLPFIIEQSNPNTVEDVIQTVFNNLPQETAYVLCAYSHELYKKLTETVGAGVSWTDFFAELEQTPAYKTIEPMIKEGKLKWNVAHHNEAAPHVHHHGSKKDICHEYPVGLATIMLLSFPAQIYAGLPHNIRDGLSIARNIDSLRVEVIDEIMKIREEMFQVTQSPCACTADEQSGCKTGTAPTIPPKPQQN